MLDGARWRSEKTGDDEHAPSSDNQRVFQHLAVVRPQKIEFARVIKAKRGLSRVHSRAAHVRYVPWERR